MMEKFLDLLPKDGADVLITRTELIPRRGYLIRYESSADGLRYEMIAFLRFLGDQRGSMELRWTHTLSGGELT
jgi:hypothetical protein